MFARLFKRSFTRTPKPQVERAVQPVVEDLEGRQLMSVSLNGTFGVTVNGDDGGVVRDDAIVVRRQASNPFNVQVLVNGQLQLTRSMSELGTLDINGRGGNDTLTFDDTSGTIALRFGGSIHYDGGDGTNTVVVTGGTSGSSSYSNGSFANTGSLRRAIGTDVQLIDFSNVDKVKDTGTATQFTFTGSADATESTFVDNGEASNDGLLRVHSFTPTKNFATVEFSNKTNVTVDTDLGTVPPGEGPAFVSGNRDFVTVQNTQSAIGLASITLNTHTGADSVRVVSTAVPLTVNTGSGNDTITIGSRGQVEGLLGGTVDGIGPRVTVTDTLDPFETLADPTATTGNNVLTVDDSGDKLDQDAELTSSTITGLGMVEGVSYSGMDQVNVKLGSGSDALRIRSTARGVTYTADGGDGNDFFRLGSAGIGGEDGFGTVDRLAGALTINGGGGSANKILVDDSGDLDANVGVVTNTQIAGMGMAAVNYSGIQGITLKFGFGVDTFVNQVVPSATSPLVFVDLGPQILF